MASLTLSLARNTCFPVPYRYGARRRSSSRRGTGRGGPQRCRAQDVTRTKVGPSVAAGADPGVTGGRLECMSGRQLARTGGGGRNSKPWDIQQADKSIRVRNAGERLLPRPRFSATTSLVGLNHRSCAVNFQTACGMLAWLAGGRGSGLLPSVPHAPFGEARNWNETASPAPR